MVSKNKVTPKQQRERESRLNGREWEQSPFTFATQVEQSKVMDLSISFFRKVWMQKIKDCKTKRRGGYTAGW